jgi:hypothetical protein
MKSCSLIPARFTALSPTVIFNQSPEKPSLTSVFSGGDSFEKSRTAQPRERSGGKFKVTRCFLEDFLSATGKEALRDQMIYMVKESFNEIFPTVDYSLMPQIRITDDFIFVEFSLATAKATKQLDAQFLENMTTGIGVQTEKIKPQRKKK